MKEEIKKISQNDSLLRLSDVLQIIPVSRAYWWSKVKSGDFPQPIKLSPKITCWKRSEVLALFDGEA